MKIDLFYCPHCKDFFCSDELMFRLDETDREITGCSGSIIKLELTHGVHSLGSVLVRSNLVSFSDEDFNKFSAIKVIYDLERGMITYKGSNVAVEEPELSDKVVKKVLSLVASSV